MNATTRRVASIGECMIELVETAPGEMRRGFGGDSLNMAVYLARAAGRTLAVDYVTALGDDPYSDEMIAAWESESVGTGLVARLPGRLPGLHAVHADEKGERSFYYWRSAAAAREMFRSPMADQMVGRLLGYELIYVTGITVSILDEESRRRLLELLDAARANGAQIVADTNYRPRNWRDAGEARHWTEAMFRLADIGLPSDEDQESLFGDADAGAAADRLHGFGVGEVVIKGGDRPCLLSWPGGRLEVPPEPAGRPVDTTAAGDSFNAGYISGRLAGMEPPEAARRAHRLAAAVVMHRGAILPRAAMPDL